MSASFSILSVMIYSRNKQTFGYSPFGIVSAQKIIDLKLSPLSEDKATRLVIERRKGGGLNLPLWMLLAVALVGILQIGRAHV